MTTTHCSYRDNRGTGGASKNRKVQFVFGGEEVSELG